VVHNDPDLHEYVYSNRGCKKSKCADAEESE
jgi:hypothetical protein